jgi:hypothetical protein
VTSGAVLHGAEALQMSLWLEAFHDSFSPPDWMVRNIPYIFRGINPVSTKLG